MRHRSILSGLLITFGLTSLPPGPSFGVVQGRIALPVVDAAEGLDANEGGEPFSFSHLRSGSWALRAYGIGRALEYQRVVRVHSGREVDLGPIQATDRPAKSRLDVQVRNAPTPDDLAVVVRRVLADRSRVFVGCFRVQEASFDWRPKELGYHVSGSGSIRPALASGIYDLELVGYLAAGAMSCGMRDATYSTGMQIAGVRLAGGVWRPGVAWS